jgi:hypothetical protein
MAHVLHTCGAAEPKYGTLMHSFAEVPVTHMCCCTHRAAELKYGMLMYMNVHVCALILGVTFAH